MLFDSLIFIDDISTLLKDKEDKWQELPTCIAKIR